jgi:hypothetical protein
MKLKYIVIAILLIVIVHGHPCGKDNLPVIWFEQGEQFSSEFHKTALSHQDKDIIMELSKYITEEIESYKLDFTPEKNKPFPFFVQVKTSKGAVDKFILLFDKKLKCYDFLKSFLISKLKKNVTYENVVVKMEGAQFRFGNDWFDRRNNFLQLADHNAEEFVIETVSREENRLTLQFKDRHNANLQSYPQYPRYCKFGNE